MLDQKNGSAFSGYQLIGVFKRMDGQLLSDEKASHFWEEVVMLAEQHDLIINGGIRGLTDVKVTKEERH